MVVLRYFDPLNFAQDIRCPSLVGLSRKDEVVPPEPSCDGGASAGSVRAEVVPDKPQRLARGEVLDGVREVLSRPDLVRLARSLPA